MSPTIVPRSAWGFSGWAGPTYAVDIGARDYFFNHYFGNAMPEQYRRGNALPQQIHKEHLANGWVGIGYGFVIDLDGIAYEGRGWGLVGAHCPNFNTRGLSVMYAVGGDQPLSDAQKTTGRWFRDEHARRRGNLGITTVVHGDRYPTACAGKIVTPWVHGGMIVPVTAPAPVPVPQPQPPTPAYPVPAFKLSVDGKLGANTVRALQTRLRATGLRGKDGKILVVDGITGVNTTWALQNYLNAKLTGANIVVDGYGFSDNLKASYGPTQTVKQLQRWLASPQDGVLSYPSSAAVKRMQDRLNRGNF